MRWGTLPRRLIWAPLLGLSLIVLGCDQTTPAPSEQADPGETNPSETSYSDAASNEDASNGPDGSARSDATPQDTTSTAPPARPTRSSTPKDVTFDTIKLELEKDEPFDPSLLTPEVKAIVDRPIRIRGYILPSFQQTGLTQFVLVRDNMECCFGPGAALHDCIVVQMKPGKSTDFSVRPVTVEGTFSVNELFDPDGKHLAIYHLSGDRVN